jgi:hypothetical protein
MWAYKAWQGLHLPDHLARREQLGVYASWCNAVEGNTTFYGLPAPRTVASRSLRVWRRRASRSTPLPASTNTTARMMLLLLGAPLPVVGS